MRAAPFIIFEYTHAPRRLVQEACDPQSFFERKESMAKLSTMFRWSAHELNVDESQGIYFHH